MPWESETMLPREYSFWWAHGSKCSKPHPLDQTTIKSMVKLEPSCVSLHRWKMEVNGGPWGLPNQGEGSIDLPSDLWALLLLWGARSICHGEVWVMLECCHVEFFIVMSPSTLVPCISPVQRKHNLHPIVRNVPKCVYLLITWIGPLGPHVEGRSTPYVGP